MKGYFSLPNCTSEKATSFSLVLCRIITLIFQELVAAFPTDLQTPVTIYNVGYTNQREFENSKPSVVKDSDGMAIITTRLYNLFSIAIICEFIILNVVYLFLLNRILMI